LSTVFILTAEIAEKAEKMKPRDFTDFHKIENKKTTDKHREKKLIEERLR